MQYAYNHMLKYFLEKEESQLDQGTKSIIKTHYIKKRQYNAFHLDCSYTKKKLCYCSAFPISKIVDSNKVRLWESYQNADDYYSKTDPSFVEKGKGIYEHCRDKIKKLSKSEVAEFVRNLRNEKNMHMGENGQYQNS